MDIKEIKINDNIRCKDCPNLGGKVNKITKNYVYYIDSDGVEQPIHKSNIKNYIKTLNI